MTTLTSAIAPILVLILLGFGLRRAHFLSDDAWAGLEKLTYFILFPALLVRELANQRLTGVPCIRGRVVRLYSRLRVRPAAFSRGSTIGIVQYRKDRKLLCRHEINIGGRL
jgi:hypothetical protein